MHTRIKQVLDYSGLNQQEFAERIAIAPATLSNILKGKQAKYSTELVMSITSAYPEIDVLWLMSGKGDMFVPRSSDEHTDNPSLDAQSDVNNNDNLECPPDYASYGEDSLFGGLANNAYPDDVRMASKSPTSNNDAENQVGRKMTSHSPITDGRASLSQSSGRNARTASGTSGTIHKNGQSAAASEYNQRVSHFSPQSLADNPAVGGLKSLDKSYHRIMEIRVYFDDGTYEVFSPNQS